MTDKRLVDIGDGRIVEMTEMGDGKPEPTPIKKQRSKNPGSRDGLRKKSDHAATFKNSPKGIHKLGVNSLESKMTIPGYREWLAGRQAVTERLFIQKTKSRKDVPDGIRREEAEKLWEIARQKAKVDMENLKKAGVLDESDTMAEEAMLATLEVMRSPMNQQTKLQAARQVLEWTKAKPASKTEMTVNAAEAWLASLAEDDAKSD